METNKPSINFGPRVTARREREGAKLEFYYNEFVKRDWYPRDKELFDATGRRRAIFWRRRSSCGSTLARGGDSDEMSLDSSGLEESSGGSSAHSVKPPGNAIAAASILAETVVIATGVASSGPAPATPQTEEKAKVATLKIPDQSQEKVTRRSREMVCGNLAVSVWQKKS